MTDEAHDASAETLPGKVWICPGCGNRYGAPTTCTNQHEPIEAEEFDLAPEDETAATAADGDENAPVVPIAPAPVDAAHEDLLQKAHAALTDAHTALDDARTRLDDLLTQFSQS